MGKQKKNWSAEQKLSIVLSVLKRAGNSGRSITTAWRS